MSALLLTAACCLAAAPPEFLDQHNLVWEVAPKRWPGAWEAPLQQHSDHRRLQRRRHPSSFMFLKPVRAFEFFG